MSQPRARLTDSARLDRWFMDDRQYLATWDDDVDAAASDAADAPSGAMMMLVNTLITAPAAMVAMMMWGL